MMRSLILCLCLAAYCYGDFIIPEATLEFLNPRGLKISIPDVDPDVTLVAFHINVNEEFYGVEHGQWAADVLKRRGGRWTWIFPEVRVKQGDTVYYWVYVIRNGLGFQDLDRSYKVQNNPHSIPTQKPQPPPPTLITTTEAPTPVPVDWKNCKMSLTSVRDGAAPCTDRVVFNANFNSRGDLAQWQFEGQIGGDQLDDSFTVFTNYNEVIRVIDGHLKISPILLEQKFSPSFVTTGLLQLDSCTAADSNFCKLQAVSYLILPPVVSARITTKNSFSFRYGTVEIKAKLPKGDWIVPELWLEPKDKAYGIYSGRIIMGLSRGNERLTIEGRPLGSKLLEAGVLLNATYGPTFQRTQDVSWANDYHVFKLVWTPNSLAFSVDDQLIDRIAPDTALDPTLGGDKIAPFDREFYVTLGVHVGGLRDFPDSAMNRDQQKPWKNTDPKSKLKFWQSKDKWFPTWTEDASLLVEYVKVTAL